MNIMTTAKSANGAMKAQKNQRHRKGEGHPATADLYYTDSEWEFMKAIEDWKKSHGRQFPTWADVLRVLVSIGYKKVGRQAPETTKGSGGC